MGNEVTPDAMRGLLIPDTRITHATIDAALSNYTQALPQPGVPVPANATGVALTTSGAQRNGQTVELQTVGAAGCAAPSRSTPYTFAWRNSGGIWQGWDGPTVMSGMSALHTWTTVVGTAYNDTDTVVTSTGTILVAASHTSLTSDSIRVIRKTLSGGLSLTTIVQSSWSASLADRARACLCKLPGTGIALFVMVKDATTAQWAIRVYRSDDDGATWTLQADNAISSNGKPSPSTQIRRLRAAYYAGQVLLVVAIRNTSATCRDALWQYASATDGYSFSLRDTSPGTSLSDVYNGGAHDIAVIPGRGFLLVYATSAFVAFGANSAIYSILIPSAYVPFQSQDAVALTSTSPSASLSGNGALSDGTDLSISTDDDGTVYLFSAVYNAADYVRSLRFTNDGRTWYSLGEADPGIPEVQTSPMQFDGNQPGALSSAWYAGTLYVVCTVLGSARSGNLGLVALAGYTGATFPLMTEQSADRLTSVGGRLHYLPFDLPVDLGWTTTGAATLSLTNNGTLSVNKGFSPIVNFSATATNPGGSTIVGAFEADPNTATSASGRIVNDTGTSRYEVTVSVQPLSIVVRDGIAAVDLVTYLRNSSGFVGVRMFVRGGFVDVWVSENTTGAHLVNRDYVRIASVSLTSGASVALQQQFEAGCGAGISLWRYWWWNSYRDCSSVNNISVPSGLAGRAMSAYPVEVSQGLGLSASGGPVVTGLTWSIPPRFAHGIEQVDPLRSASPSSTWRSSNTNQQQIVWTTSATTSPLMGSLGALYIGGANFRTATLEGRDAGGAWVTIGTWDASVGQTGLRYNRNGQVVQPVTATPGTVGAYWYPYGVLDGSRVLLAGAGPMRVIERQAEGAWTHQATKHARLQLAGDMTGLPTSGTLSVVPRGAVLLWNTDTMYRAFRLTIPTQPVAETYYEAGVIMIGHVAVFGRRYSWGRSLTLDPNTTLTTGNSGRRTSYVEGPSRRAVEFGWTDGTDQTQLTSDMSGSQPDYFRASASGTPEPVAATPDGPYLMRGIIDQLDGPAVPIVYLPFLTRSPSGTTQMVTHPDLSLYGRVVSGSSVETVQGTEWGSKAAEVVRTSQVRIEQEV